MSYVSYAQNFEDVLLWRALRGVKNGTYIDVGAQDPVVDSVSLSFYEAGWRGIHVEPTPYYAARLREARPDERVIEAAVTDEPGPIDFFEIPHTGLSTGKVEIVERHSQSDFPVRKLVVPCVRLDRLLGMLPEDPHWLKIDVEGMEGDVLRSWGKSEKRPWLIVIESTIPNSEEPTEHLWRHELESRGYRDVFFDGLSRYFVHEQRSELESFFGRPANVFDGFELSRHHFATRRLRDEIDETSQHLGKIQSELGLSQSSLREAEGQFATARSLLEDAESRAQLEKDAVSNLRRELVLSERRIADEQSRVGELQAQLADAERGAQQERAKISALQLHLESSRKDFAKAESRIESLQALLAEVRQVKREIQAEHRAMQRKLARSEAAQRELIDTHWRDRQAAEQVLRDQAQAVEADLKRALDEALASAGQTREDLSRTEGREAALQLRLAATELEFGQHRDSARRDHESLEGELQRSVTDLGEVQRLINAAFDSNPGGWARMGEALRLARPQPAWTALRSWSPNIQIPAPPGPASFSIDNQAEDVMQLSGSQGGRNPLLRADSLADLLSWEDVDFVRCAYVTVLGRRPDEEGESYYTGLIRRGTSKLQVLWQLRTSREAKNHDPGIAGFDRTLRRFRRAKMPLLGPLVSPRYAREWLPAEHRARRIENTLWRSHHALGNRLEKMEASLRQAQAQSIAVPTPAVPSMAPAESREKSLGFSELVRNEPTDQMAVDALSRFASTAVLNIRNKLGKS